MRRTLTLLVASLAILAAAVQPTTARAEPLLGAAPPAPPLAPAMPAGHTAYSNASLAELFVTLTHDLEWGGARPNLVRYEAPIRVGLSGRGAERYRDFLAGYLAELRARARVPIALGGPPHNLAVRFVPGDAFRASVPRHLCVVVPGTPDWQSFARSPRRHGTRSFENATAVQATTVFIPDDAEPYLVRACLLEEVAQALGPANDLYGLGPSIFNDDAAHLWPTELDYLLLAVLYAPELYSGLGRGESRQAALAALDRLNPAGRHAPPLPAPQDAAMADWLEALRDAFDRARSPARRLASAQEALAIAARRAPLTAYHCRSLTALARAHGDAPRAALDALAEAARICTRAHGPNDIRLAQIRLDQARLLYRIGRPGSAARLAEGLAATFAAHGQDERLAALYDLQAAALGAIHRPGSAEAYRRAVEWRAYARGDAASGGAGTTTGGVRWVGN